MLTENGHQCRPHKGKLSVLTLFEIFDREINKQIQNRYL